MSLMVTPQEVRRPLRFSAPKDPHHFSTALPHDRFETNYEKQGQAIGEGTYGTVWKAIDKRNNTVVALKKVNLKNEREGFPTTSIREISVLQRCQNKHVVKLLDVCMSLPSQYNKHKGTVYLVFEFCDNDLSGLLQYRKRHLQLEEIKCLMKQLLNALVYIHENDVCHRDLKLSNILINKSGELKLADFGLARVMQSQKNYTNRVITLWYRPPELLLGSKVYDFCVDVWSAGCILGELLHGRALFPFDTEIKVFTAICSCLGGVPSNNDPRSPLYWPELYEQTHLFPSYNVFIPETRKALEPSNTSPPVAQPQQNLSVLIQHIPSKQVMNLMQRLLAFDRTRRPSASEAYEHSFFQETPKACLPSEIKINQNMCCHELNSLKHVREREKERAKQNPPKRARF